MDIDPIDLLQRTLSALVNSAVAANGTITNGTIPIPTSNPTPTLFNISSLISMLLSFSALRDWLKLIVIGGAIETCRRLCFSLWYWLIESFWITASFDEDDSSYQWIMYWMSKHPQWTQARTVDVSTRSFGLTSTAITVSGDDDDDAENHKLSYLPSFSKSYTLWYKRHYMTIMRVQYQNGLYRMSESLQIKILARNHSVLNSLLLEAKKTYKAAQEHLISIYVADTANNWRLVASRPKRPLKSIVLDPGMKDLILDDARDFLASKTWYSERGIPFRRGYLLYGAPGSGKTSIIHSLAGELGLDVYVVSLSRVGLDDTSLSELISELPERCIALMEDIDAAFHHGLTRDFDSEEDEKPEDRLKTPEMLEKEKEREKEKDKASVSSPSSRITLSGLLNALDGVGAQEGRILFATTNRYTALDPALCRPGRMDLHVEFKLASKFQARELFMCFYLPSDPSEEESSVSDDINTDTEKPDAEVDSAYGSGESTPTSSVDGNLIDLDSTTPSIPTTPTSSSSTSPSKSTSFYTGHSHLVRAPKLTSKQVSALASRFADAIPERESSMASLQGYLMAYKTRPVEAVNEIEKWVEKERIEKEKKSKKKRGVTVSPSSTNS